MNLQARKILNSEVGFRSVTSEETFSNIQKMLLSTGFEVRFEQRWLKNTPYFYHLMHWLNPVSKEDKKVFVGKGFSEKQCMISAVMEFIERFCSSNIDNKRLTEATYNEIRHEARDPDLFVLPSNSSYHPDSVIDWVEGFSLTKNDNTLVPANLAFFLYEPKNKKNTVSSTDTNGLASGNNLEEAILHALLEVVERDSRLIMEYNQLTMPDIVMNMPDDDHISKLLKSLENNNIEYRIKDITLDIPISSIGAFLKGKHKGEEVYSYSSGTHLKPINALRAALTEALQLYPKCSNYKEWLESGPIDYLYKESDSKIYFNHIPDKSSNDIKLCINKVVNILEKYNAEVIVVDLSHPKIMFPVVRVLVTGLQPLPVKNSPRYSERLFDVPVKIGKRGERMNPESIHIRNICGYLLE